MVARPVGMVGNAMRKLLIALAVLVVLFVAADRISVAIAENRISDRIAAAYGLPSKPGVTIGGFPFLTQVAAGDYGHVDVSAGRVQADGATLRNLRVQFTGVHASLSQVLGRGPATVTADRATGSAMIGLGQVNRRLPRGLKVQPDGKNLRVSGTVRYQGARIPVSATVSLGVTGSGITVTPVNVTAPGRAGVPLSAYSPQLGVVVPVSTLPLHLRVTSVRVTNGGLRIGASARNVLFAHA